MAIAECIHLTLELRLEFRTTVCLKQIHMTVKSSLHTLVEELITIFCRQRWCQENINFPTEDINRGESKEFSEINAIYLYYLSRLNGLGYWASLFVFLPLRVYDILFG